MFPSQIPVRWIALVGIGLLSACAESRGYENSAACPTWEQDLATLLVEQCASCHSGSAPEGDYDVTTYEGLLGGGTDTTANAIATDAESLILTTLDPLTADDTHDEFTDTYERLRTWIVDCELGYRASRVHEPGLLNPASPDFHGALLRDRDWEFSLCASCHGDAFLGGTARSSCLTCHADGPTDCSTCHQEGPTSGAHLGHAAAHVDCAECHVVPASWDVPGHILTGDGTRDEGPAEVVLGDLAGAALAPEARQGPPTFTASTQRCSNVYCHGAALADPSGQSREPGWYDSGPLDCTSCHGMGPQSHADARCSACHSRVVDASNTIIDSTLHLSGSLELGTQGDACNSCHGSADSPAPPMDVLGRTARAEVTVGVHQSHTEGPHLLRGPIPCSDCHLEPDALQDSGHIDSAGPAEVFPGLEFAGLAARDGATPSWDRGAATCSDVYCHGGGVTLGNDAAPGIFRTPNWTQRDAAAHECGGCHGIPPRDGRHNPSLKRTQCWSCHITVVDPAGNIILRQVGDEVASEHIDGTVDVY